MNKLLALLFLIIFTQLLAAQYLTFEKIELSDSIALSNNLQVFSFGLLYWTSKLF